MIFNFDALCFFLLLNIMQLVLSIFIMSLFTYNHLWIFASSTLNVSLRLLPERNMLLSSANSIENTLSYTVARSLIYI